MNSEQATEKVKRAKPSSLKVTLRDGTEKPVSVPKAGNRWARTQQVLDSLPWVTIECLDKDGRVLSIVEQDDDEDADLIDEDPDSPMALASVFARVQRDTMKECRMMFDVQTRAQAELMQALAEGQRALVSAYEGAMRVQALPPTAGDQDEVLKMMQMFMLYQQQQKSVGGGQ